MHFLMPYIFRSRKEFSYWFANPLTSMIEGTSNQNDDVVRRLHGIIRPFVLRRLKKDVETQLPGKFEHILKCQLSRRQVRHFLQLVSSDCAHLIRNLDCSKTSHVTPADVYLRRIHGTIINKTGTEERWKFHGNDECLDAVEKSLQPSRFV